MNIFQSERIFVMQDENSNTGQKLKYRTMREENRAILTQNRYLKYNTDFWDIEQTFQIENKYLKYGINI